MPACDGCITATWCASYGVCLADTLAPVATVPLERLIEFVNTRNRVSGAPYHTKQHREGWNGLLTQVLVDARVYDGYTYLTDAEVPPGELPGQRGVAPDIRIIDDTRVQFQTGKLRKAAE